MSTLLCVPIPVSDADSALDDASTARDAGADLVEFRLDSFFTGAPGEEGEREQNEIVRIVSGSPLPCIVTCRPSGPEAGEAAGVGGYDGDEQARIALFERLAIAAGENIHPPRYIDIELSTFERSANIRQKIKLAVDHPEQIRDLRTSLILSTHDFQGRPADLFRRLARMRAEPAAAVFKIAYMARSIRDNLDVLDLLADADHPTIALAMGRFGLMSRVLAPKFNAFLTFASLRPASATAPGQPTVEQLLSKFRFRSIRPSTRVYAVVGYPVEHSISPAVHNAGFDHLGEWTDHAGVKAGGVYLPLPIPPEYEHFKASILALLDHKRLDFCGCSVTIPHKEHLVRLANEEMNAGRPWGLDHLSKLSGAANTLAIERDAHGDVVRCHVANTDGPAALGALVELLGEIRAKRIGILGAGGVARSIAAALANAQAHVVIFARERSKAAALADELSPLVNSELAREDKEPILQAADLDDAGRTPCDAYVNCTPVGMTGGPAPDQSPVKIAEIAALAAELGGTPPVVMDTVYTPLQTRLLSDAAAAGLHTIDGLSMFVRQAAAQFHAWTGQDPPAGLFEKEARKELSGHNN